MVTISTHNGSAAHREHNVRNAKVVSKEEHIEKKGKYEIWKDETPRQAYHKLFDEAVKKYNEQQTRKERKIKNYYTQIEKDEKKHPVYEMIIGVYPDKEERINEETQREIMKEFVDKWQERNPNLYMCGAYYHADEQGEPHVHIDYIPIAHGYTKGMEVQTGLVKALGEQGFEKKGKATAQILWEQRENQYLEKLCQERGLEVSHPGKEKEHVRTELYKAQKALESTIDHTKGLLDIQDEIRANTGKLEAKRDKAEKQVEKALERKAKAFSKTWKKDKEKGWEYDKGLEKEIRTLVKERAEDVKAISQTKLDVQVEYDEARTYREKSIKEAEQMKARAREELEKAQELRDNIEEHIQRRAEYQARQQFQAFKQKEFGKAKEGREERLEEYCSKIKFNDGQSVLDKFEAQEKELLQSLEHKWSYSR